MSEEWKEIPFAKNYLVSSNGNIFSKIKNRVLKPANNGHGYLHCSLITENGKKTIRIHKLVANLFIDNPNNYNVVNHKDLNKKNNSCSNLEWCTLSENSVHFIKHHFKNGGICFASKLTTKDIVEILKNKDGLSTSELSVMYKVSKPTIRNILSGRRFKRIGEKIGFNYREDSKMQAKENCSNGHSYAIYGELQKGRQGKIVRKCTECKRIYWTRRKELQKIGEK